MCRCRLAAHSGAVCETGRRDGEARRRKERGRARRRAGRAASSGSVVAGARLVQAKRLPCLPVPHRRRHERSEGRAVRRQAAAGRAGAFERLSGGAEAAGAPRCGDKGVHRPGVEGDVRRHRLRVQARRMEEKVRLQRRLIACKYSSLSARRGDAAVRTTLQCVRRGSARDPPHPRASSQASCAPAGSPERPKAAMSPVRTNASFGKPACAHTKREPRITAQGLLLRRSITRIDGAWPEGTQATSWYFCGAGLKEVAVDLLCALQGVPAATLGDAREHEAVRPAGEGEEERERG